MAATYIAKNPSGLYLFRYIIPARLRFAFNGRTAIRRSLKTHHRPTAIKRARKLAVEVEELLRMANRIKGKYIDIDRSEDQRKVKTLNEQSLLSDDQDIASLLNSDIGRLISLAIKTSNASEDPNGPPESKLTMADIERDYPAIDPPSMDSLFAKSVNCPEGPLKALYEELWDTTQLCASVHALIPANVHEVGQEHGWARVSFEAAHIDTLEENALLSESEAAAFNIVQPLLALTTKQLCDKQLELLEIEKIQKEHHDQQRSQSAREKAERLLNLKPIAQTTQPQPAAKPTGPLLSQAMTEFVEYQAERGVKLGLPEKGPKDSPWGGYTPPFRMFLAVAGDKPTNLINTDDLKKYAKIAPKIPNNNAKGAAKLLAYNYETLTFANDLDTIISVAKKRGYSLPAQKTVADSYSHIKTFINWLAVDNDYLPMELTTKAESILAGRKAPKGKGNKAESSYDKYNREQLNALFAFPQFNPNAPYKRHQNANAFNSADFWLPVLAFYTGARGGELAQLHTDDIKKIDDVWCIRITRNGDDQGTKTGSSIRLVPIHDRLIEIGLLEFHSERIAEKQHQLFYELRQTEVGKTDPFKLWGKRFAKNVIKKIKGDDEKLTFHSFRGTLVTELRNQGVVEENRMQIVGHSRSGAHQRYTEDLPLDKLQPLINKAVYEGVNQEHLSWADFKEKRLGK